MNRPHHSASEKLPGEVWALLFAAFVIALGYGVVAPVLPQYARSFGVSNTAATSIASAFALMRLLGAPGAGWLVQRFGERSIYVVGLLGVAASTAACALVANFEMLLVMRGLGGIGSAMFGVASSGLVIRLSPVQSRGRVQSYYGSGFILGNILGPSLGAVVANWGMQAPFVLYAVALVLAAIIVIVAMRGSARVGRQEKSDKPPMTFLDAVRVPAYRAALVSSFANGWTSLGARMSLIPLFVGTLAAGNGAAAGIALTAFAVGNAIMVIPGGIAADRLGRRPTLITGLFTGAAATFCYGFAPNLWVLCALAVAAGIGAALIAPAQQASVADVIGSERNGGQVLAAFQMTSDLGVVIGPVIAASLADSIGFRPAFMLCAAILAVAGMVWVVTKAPRRAT